jgi:hypothetical protein
MTLALSVAFHFAAVHTRNQERFLHLALEVIYFTKENLPATNLSTLENLTSNTLLLHAAESLKNEKKNDKIQESQRLITEMYVQLMIIKEKAAEVRKQQIRHKMKANKWLNSLKKVDRIIREANMGSFEYLQYLDFYKSFDKDLLKSLVIPLRSQQKP